MKPGNDESDLITEFCVREDMNKVGLQKSGKKKGMYTSTKGAKPRFQMEVNTLILSFLTFSSKKF